jgi:hypothetical protein
MIYRNREYEFWYVIGSQVHIDIDDRCPNRVIYLFSTYALQPSGLIVRSGLDFQLSPPDVSTRVTTPELLAAKSGTVGEKCPRILPNMPNSTLHLGIFYMP